MRGASVEVGVGVAWVHLQHAREIGDGQLIHALLVEADAAVVKGVGVCGVQFNDARVVRDGGVKVARLGEAVAPVVQRLDVVWLQVQGPGVVCVYGGGGGTGSERMKGR